MVWSSPETASNAEEPSSKVSAPDINLSPTKMRPKAVTTLPIERIFSCLLNIVMNTPAAAKPKKNMVSSDPPSAMTHALSVVPMLAPMMMAVA